MTHEKPAFQGAPPTEGRQVRYEANAITLVTKNPRVLFYTGAIAQTELVPPTSETATSFPLITFSDKPLSRDGRSRALKRLKVEIDGVHYQASITTKVAEYLALLQEAGEKGINTTQLAEKMGVSPNMILATAFKAGNFLANTPLRPTVQTDRNRRGQLEIGIHSLRVERTNNPATDPRSLTT